MSEKMLLNVLGMPYELAMSSELSRRQFYNWAQHALDEINQLKAEVKHWKGNHDNQVAKSALLTQRPDLPVDRLPAYKELERLQAEVAELKEVWNNPAKLHVNLLRSGYDRMSALHLAGATDYDSIKARNSELRARLAEADKDAARYQFLRHADFNWADKYEGDLPAGEEFDALVDQAMKESQ